MLTALKFFALIAVVFGLGVAVGYRWSESKYDHLRSELDTLTGVDLDEYLRLKNLEEKYAKADEMLGKAILIFFADLKLKISDDKLQFARSAAEKTPPSALPHDRVHETPAPTPDAEPTSGMPNARSGSEVARDGGDPVDTRPRGLIGGTVLLGSPAPQAVSYHMAADPVCNRAVNGQTQRKEDSVVGEGGQIANALVYLRDRPRGPKPPVSQEPVVLRQSACRYDPHVVGIQVGQKLRISNEDATLHNVHSDSRSNPDFNFGQPSKGMVTEKTFLRPELVVKLKCDVHGWMNAYVGVFDHPYFAVTDKDGKFEIKGVPPGEYYVDVWHERFGKRTRRIRIAPNSLVAGLRFNYAE